MFRENTSHLQSPLFGIAHQLPKANLDKLNQSKEHDFYLLVFCKINEEDFSLLYSDTSSRPNAPVNTLVASIILMYQNKKFTKPFNHKGKLRVRGLFKMMVYAHAMAISINFGRVWRYLAENREFFVLSDCLFGILPCFIAKNSHNEHRKILNSISDKPRKGVFLEWTQI